MVRVRQDHYAHTVIGLEEYRGVPVLIHGDGLYPSIEDERSTPIDCYISVVVSSTGEQYGVWVLADSGCNGRIEALRVGEADSLDAARLFFPAALTAIAEAPVLFAKHAEIQRKYAPWAGPLSRQEYEVLAAELGFEPLADKDLSEWGIFTFPRYSLEDLPKLLTNQRRACSYDSEMEIRAAQDALSARLKKAARMDELRREPVTRVEKRFVPFGSLPDEFLKGSELFTVVSRGERRRIDEDDASIYGGDFLGEEGGYGETVTLEVRGHERHSPTLDANGSDSVPGPGLR